MFCVFVLLYIIMIIIMIKNPKLCALNNWQGSEFYNKIMLHCQIQDSTRNDYSAETQVELVLNVVRERLNFIFKMSEIFWNLNRTRMHSSGMRTARLLTISQHALGGGCIPAYIGQGLCIPTCTGLGGHVSQHALPRGCLPGGVWQTPPGTRGRPLPQKPVKT